MHSQDLPAIVERRRLASPARFPQALAVEPGGRRIHVTPRQEPLLYTIVVDDHVVAAEITLPTPAWGAVLDGRVVTYVSSEGPDDDRSLRRYDLERDVHDDAVVRCPDGTGSYVARRDGGDYLTQFYRRRLLRLDAAGAIVASVDLPRDVAGLACGPDAFYCVTTEAEDGEDYRVTRVDFDAAQVRDVARLPLRARSLAWDGERFWTCHRERHEIVAFTLPDGT